MAENENGEQTNETETVEFWKAKAREWETRSKENHRELKARESELSDLNGQLAEATKRGDDLEAANTELTGKVEGFESAKARTDLIAKIAGEKNVSADFLAKMRGDTEEELTAAADNLVAMSRANGPVVETAGKVPPSQPSTDAIEAVHDLFGTE